MTFTLFQTLLTVVFGLAITAVGLSEFLAMMFLIGATFATSKWWEKITAAFLALMVVTLAVWEINHDFWRDSVLNFIKTL